jgi:hypothetical protein
MDRRTLSFAVLILALAATARAAPQDRLPRVHGDYLRARAELIRLGFRPMRRTYDIAPQDVCDDWTRQATCSRSALSEGNCAIDIVACRFYWTTPGGRVVSVDTYGAARAGWIGRIYWASASDFDGMVDSPPP